MNKETQIRSYTPEEVAEIYQVSKNTIYKLIAEKKIKSKKISERIIRIPYTEVMWAFVGLDKDIQTAVVNDVDVLSKDNGTQLLKDIRKGHGQ